jgi:type III secretory pathway component EscV
MIMKGKKIAKDQNLLLHQLLLQVAMTLVLPMPTAPIQITFATLLKMAINAG